MAPTTMRSVVLPQGLSGHHTQAHKDAWHQWEGLVVILVAIHLVAFVFWCYLLYASKERRRKEGKGGGNGGIARSAALHTSRGAAEWRSPREILAQFEKARLGKV